jgi:hypothetical protein
MTEAPPINIAEVRSKVFHAEQMLSHTEAAAIVRINAVIEAGKALTLVKESMKHGEWGPWVKDNLEGITQQTATNWMKLHAFHEANGDEIFDEAKSVRQAYKLAGIIPEVSSTGSKRSSATVDYVLHLTRLELALRKMDFTSMAPEDKAVVKGRLEGVVRVYNGL